MRSQRCFVPFLIPALILALIPGACLLFASSAARAEMTLTVETASLAPAKSGQSRVGFVSGKAIAHQGSLEQFDVVFLLDVSGSTKRSSGADIDGDGRRRGSADSILAAEVAAVRALLDQMDPRHVRVAITAFSGSQHKGGDHAWVEVSMTRDFDRARRGLEEIFLLGPNGGTNMRAGLRVARIEVRQRDRKNPDRRASRHIVMLTDGHPAVPNESQKTSENKAIQEARKLGKERIPVHAYAIGRKATRNPRAAVQIARQSGGNYVAVQDPGDLGSMLSEIDFSSVDEVQIRNLTTGASASQIAREADGTYSGLVPVAEGENEIEIYARASDGSEKRETRTVRFEQKRLDARQRASVARLLTLDALAVGREGKKTRRELEIEAEEEDKDGEEDEN